MDKRPRAVRPIPSGMLTTAANGIYIFQTKTGPIKVPNTTAIPEMVTAKPTANNATSIPINPIAGPKTMTKLKKPSPTAAKIALIILFAEVVFSASFIILPTLLCLAIIFGSPSET